jgi:indolepyruvate ferredoxin oxidoreductase, alpha subunit
MNSGTSIASGVALAVAGRQQVVSLIGDSTLLHSGLQTLMESAWEDSDQICFVLANDWTAMTGHQRLPVTPRADDGKPSRHLNWNEILRGLGIARFDRVDPLQTENVRALLRRLLPQRGFRVVLVERECKLQQRRRPPQPGWHPTFAIEPERCHACLLCYEQFCCPAITVQGNDPPVIDPELCSACGACAALCPNSAIIRVQHLRPAPSDEPEQS